MRVLRQIQSPHVVQSSLPTLYHGTNGPLDFSDALLYLGLALEGIEIQFWKLPVYRLLPYGDNSYFPFIGF
jgi:hypothetical protein